MSPDDCEKRILDLLTEEYKTLRQESLQTIQSKITITGFSFTALSLSGSVVVASGSSSFVIAFTLGFIIPLLANTVSHIWIGEHRRSQRAGKAITLVETELNHRIKFKALKWESGLREERHQRSSTPYLKTLSLFNYISRFSIAVSYIYIRESVNIVIQMYNSAYANAITAIILSVIIALQIRSEIKLRDAWKEACSWGF